MLTHPLSLNEDSTKGEGDGSFLRVVPRELGRSQTAVSSGTREVTKTMNSNRNTRNGGFLCKSNGELCGNWDCNSEKCTIQSVIERIVAVVSAVACVKALVMWQLWLLSNNR